MDSQAIESEVLRHFYYDIQTAIAHSIVGVAALLYQEGVVPKDIKDEAGVSKPSVEKSAAIMGAVEIAVQINSRNFWVLVAVLEKFTMTACLAVRMRDAVDLHVSSQKAKKRPAQATTTQDSASPHTEEKDTESKSSTPQGKVIVSEVYKKDFCKIEDKFVELFLGATNILRNAHVTLDKLKELLTFYPELEVPLQNAETIHTAMLVVQRHSSFITCNYLYAVADHVKIAEIREKVDAFEQLVEEFCEHSLKQHSYVDFFHAEQSKHLLSTETITFKLQWEPHEKTLQHIQGLLRKGFESYASQIHVVSLREGCLEVICYAPLYLMGALVKLARERRKMLVESKVTYLSVGYTVVLDNSVEEKISALEDEVSAVKKQEETLRMKIRALQGERTELQMLLEESGSGKRKKELKRTDKPQETPLEPVESSSDVSAQEETSLLEHKVFTLKQEKEELELKLKYLQDALTERDQKLRVHLLRSKSETAVLKPELQRGELEMRADEPQALHVQSVADTSIQADYLTKAPALYSRSAPGFGTSLVGATPSEGAELSYTTLQFYKQIPNTFNVVLNFVIVHDHQPVLEYVRQQLQNWRHDKEHSRRVWFENDTITLDLPDSVVDHWKIVPMTPPQITKVVVDQFKPELTIPSCLVELKWTGGEQVPPQELSHKVTLKGAKSPAFFHIRHDPQAVEAHAAAAGPPPTPQSNLEEHLDLTLLTCFKYNNNKGEEQRVYIMDDMAPKWKRVGRMLKFSEVNITSIATTCHDDPEACCEELLSQWLQGHNDHNDSRPKTWKTLLGVMRDAHLEELADKLQNIY